MREYTEQHYLPAAAAYRERAADKGAVGERIVRCQQTLKQKWPYLRFGEVTVQTEGQQHLFEVHVYLDDLDPDMVRVELYSDGADNPQRHELTRLRPLLGTTGGYAYRAAVPATRPATDYTPRIIPCCPGAAVPFEAANILWQR